MTAIALSNSRCQCPACGEFFNSTSIFDRHRIGAFAGPGETAHQRRCMTLSEMTARGYTRNAAGLWVERLREASTTQPEDASGPPPATYPHCGSEGAEIGSGDGA